MTVSEQIDIRKDDAVFVLAHPDDDVFIRPLISREIAAGRMCHIFVITDASSQLGRKTEMQNALRRFGKYCKIFFVGESLFVPDGTALDHLHSLYSRVLSYLKRDGVYVSSLYTHALEYGHPDHDAAYFIGLALARHFAVEAAYSVTYYRAGAVALWLTVQASHLDRDTDQPLALSLRERLDVLMTLRFYPSQWKTFAGLLPFMLIKTGLMGRLHTAPLDFEAVFRLPKHQKMSKTMSEDRFGIPPSHTYQRAQGFLSAVFGSGDGL